jgi:hypothetical protein
MQNLQGCADYKLGDSFFNYSIICAYIQTEEKSVEERDSFCDDVDRIYGDCPRMYIKIIIGDMNAKVGKEDVYKPISGKYSLHAESNDNGTRLISFASS